MQLTVAKMYMHVTMLMLKTILKMRTKIVGHYFWINLREEVNAVGCQYANLAMEVRRTGVV
jgi:hypothetical protein